MIKSQSEYNNLIVPLTSKLPDGTVDKSLNAFTNGLDGKTLFTNSAATNTSALSRYFNLTTNRPYSVYEQFQNTYNYIDASITALESSISLESGLTLAQKNRIGINVFDTGLSSSVTSIDGKTNANELNVLQVARDLYGTAYASYSGDGTAVLSNSVRDMVDALLELHNGDWDTDITLDHSAVSGSQNNIWPYQSIAATQNILVTDAVTTVDASGGAVVADLPAASAQEGLRLDFKKIDGTGNTVTVDAAGADLIDGAGTYVLSAQYDSLTLISDGVSNWWIL